jgi:hypothetical protein
MGRCFFSINVNYNMECSSSTENNKYLNTLFSINVIWLRIGISGRLL